MRTSILSRIVLWILILAVLSPDVTQKPENTEVLSASGFVENIVEPVIRLLCSEEARAWCAAVLELMLDCILLVLEFLVEVLKQALTALLTG